MKEEKKRRGKRNPGGKWVDRPALVLRETKSKEEKRGRNISS